MISLEEASTIAKKKRDDITSYTEDAAAYIFKNDKAMWDGEIVVLKRNGKVLGLSEYIMKYKTDEENKLGRLKPVNSNTRIIRKEK